ncbi:hypothetical protein MJO28_011799 [Puccinia striiformis f. sp. tritici]|uniref:Uncharacterized protein n=1 Tax=Puccinia striiformis f. sp. tritici TaxID=168172 RepID=A0ACC0E4I3_9BASI|nr:hypothetical protein MJO28_011799 [Puccinia striiformis f. sp. tritici]KAI7947031.1 hypothetical protein MJO29_011558 [Puccinia striiformis f. sp. tritici]
MGRKDRLDAYELIVTPLRMNRGHEESSPPPPMSDLPRSGIWIQGECQQLASCQMGPQDIAPE